ncbi:MAG: hypothetical protein CMH64_01090 [Nanoarchaeota archaeon]|nr:hypothetical protein [Nanoarchaeota archaeon]|tara:strand:- start:1407 stop:2033 length:627 start_codon:yes stop_codon:yes gene_type:complete
MNTLVCLDRDGTLICEDKYHLGSQKDWKKKVKIIPHVIKGIKELNKIKNLKIYMITNQPGVAVKEFKLLTNKKADEVCRYVVNKFKQKGAKIHGYYFCPHASKEFAKSHPQYPFDKSKLDQCNCMKPKSGMIQKALKHSKLKNPNIYVAGDRCTDVEAALKMKGSGVLIPFKTEPGQRAKTKKLKGKAFIKKNFSEFVKLIKNDQKNN